jgi:type VI protein secretion system component Hcp
MKYPASRTKKYFKPFHFKRPVDKASPKLAIACAGGAHIDQVLVEVSAVSGSSIWPTV